MSYSNANPSAFPDDLALTHNMTSEFPFNNNPQQSHRPFNVHYPTGTYNSSQVVSTEILESSNHATIPFSSFSLTPTYNNRVQNATAAPSNSDEMDCSHPSVSNQQQQQQHPKQHQQHNNAVQWDICTRSLDNDTPESPRIIAHPVPTVAPHTPRFSNVTYESTLSAPSQMQTVASSKPLLKHNEHVQAKTTHSTGPFLHNGCNQNTFPSNNPTMHSNYATPINSPSLLLANGDRLHAKSEPKSSPRLMQSSLGSKICKRTSKKKSPKPSRTQKNLDKLIPQKSMNITLIHSQINQNRDKDTLSLENILESKLSSPIDDQEFDKEYKELVEFVTTITEDQKKMERNKRRDKLVEKRGPKPIDPKDASRLEAALSRYRKDLLIQVLLEQVKVLVKDKFVLKKYIEHGAGSSFEQHVRDIGATVNTQLNNVNESSQVNLNNPNNVNNESHVDNVVNFGVFNSVNHLPADEGEVNDFDDLNLNITPSNS